MLDALDEKGLLYQICFTNNDWSLEKQLAEFNMVLTAGKENIMRSLMNLIPFFLSNKQAMGMLRNTDFSSEQLVIEGLRLHGPLWMMTRSFINATRHNHICLKHPHMVSFKSPCKFKLSYFPFS